MKFVVIPLMFLIGFSFLGWMGISDIGDEGLDTEGSLDFHPYSNGYYDVGGRLVADENMTVFYPDEGYIEFAHTAGSTGPWNSIPFWRNSSGVYPLYNTPNGEDDIDMRYGSFSWGSSIGLLALVLSVMVVAVVAGVHVLGVGVSDISVDAVFKITGYMALWGIFSVFALPLIVAIPMIGVFFYFFLTGMFTLGTINSVGHPSGD